MSPAFNGLKDWSGMKYRLIFLCWFIFFSLSYPFSLLESCLTPLRTWWPPWTPPTAAAWCSPGCAPSTATAPCSTTWWSSLRTVSQILLSLMVFLNHSFRLTSPQSCWQNAAAVCRSLQKGVLHSGVCTLEEWNDKEGWDGGIYLQERLSSTSCVASQTWGTTAHSSVQQQ